MTKMLLENMYRKEMKQYFEPDVNLFDFNDETKQKSFALERGRIQKYYDKHMKPLQPATQEASCSCM